jgi:hypothetical protein
MAEKKYKDIIEFVEEMSPYQIEGRLDDIIALLESFKEKYPNHSNFNIIYDYGWDHDPCFGIKAIRKETDQEYDKRLAANKRSREAAKKAKLKKEETERKEYERLRAKFEKP